MYKIKDREFLDLASALAYATSLEEFVVINGPDFEICGKFGVDSVINGKTPDGVKYDWDKSARIGRVKKERVS